MVSSRRSSRRRGCVIGLVLFGVLFAAYAWFFFSDAEPPDDADLRSNSPVILGEENGAVLVVEALGQLDPAELEDFAFSLQVLPLIRLEDPVLPTAPPDPEAYEVLRGFATAHAGALELLERAALAPEFSFEELEYPDSRIRLVYVFSAAASLAWLDGDVDRAWSLLCTFRTLVRRCIAHHPSAFDLFALIGAHQLATLHLLAIAIETPRSPDQLRGWWEELDRSMIDPDWEVALVRREYEILAEALLPGSEPLFDNALFFRSGRTHRSLAAIYRGFIDELERRAADPEFSAGRTEPVIAVQPATTAEKTLWVLSGNPIGESFARNSPLAGLYPAFAMFARETWRGESLLGVIIALRLSHSVHGAWPATLEDLPTLPFPPNDPTFGSYRAKGERAHWVTPGGVLIELRP